MTDDEVETVLRAAFRGLGREELDKRIVRVSRGLNIAWRTVREQLAAANDPVAALVVLERRYARLSTGVLKRDERRELDALADANRDRHDEVRLMAEAAVRSRRLSMSLGERVDAALGRAALLTTVPAAGIAAATSKGKPESKEPAQALNVLLSNDADGLTIAARYSTVITQFVEALEREVDVTLRRPVESTALAQTQEARDRRLVEQWAGVNSSIVAALDVQLGSSRTIENSRARLGLRRVDGTPLLERPVKRRVT